MKGRAGSALWSSWIRSVSLKICFPCADPKLNDHPCAVRLKGISILGLRMYFKGRQIFLKASHAECLRLRQLVLCQRANVQTAGAQIHKMQVPLLMSSSGMCLDMYEPVYAHVRTAQTYVPRRPMLMSYRSHYSIGIYMLWKSLESPTLNGASSSSSSGRGVMPVRLGKAGIQSFLCLCCIHRISITDAEPKKTPQPLRATCWRVSCLVLYLALFWSQGFMPQSEESAGLLEAQIRRVHMRHYLAVRGSRADAGCCQAGGTCVPHESLHLWGIACSQKRARDAAVARGFQDFM